MILNGMAKKAKETTKKEIEIFSFLRILRGQKNRFSARVCLIPSWMQNTPLLHDFTWNCFVLEIAYSHRFD